MKSDLPTGKLGRTLAGGRMAAKVGGKMLSYYAKRPFLSPETRLRFKEQTSLESAQALFQGLSLLKGTALKIAQQLSLEMDLLPEAVCRELAKACHQVPPINRALVRRVVQSGLGRPPEEAFAQFETRAFAAASLARFIGRPTTRERCWPSSSSTQELPKPSKAIWTYCAACLGP